MRADKCVWILLLIPSIINPIDGNIIIQIIK